MHPLQQHRVQTFETPANALGGFLGEPFHHDIDTATPASLPAAGGFATARAEAFNFPHTVSDSSANSRVRRRQSGRQAALLLHPYEAENYKDAYPWVLHRLGCMSTTPRISGGGGSDRRKAASPKTSGSSKKPQAKKPRTSGQGGELDRLTPASPKTSGSSKKPQAKKPRTSGQGGELDR